MGYALLFAPPEGVSELSRDGLLFLLRMCAPVVTRRDVASARWHELILAAERASKAWREARDAADQMRAAVPEYSHRTRSAYHRAMAAAAAAEEKADRLWRASERAYAATDAFYRERLAPAGEAVS